MILYDKIIWLKKKNAARLLVLLCTKKMDKKNKKLTGKSTLTTER